MPVSTPPPITNSLNWGTEVPTPSDITVYFAPQGTGITVDTLETYTSEGFNAYEKAQFQKAFDRIEAVADVTFRVVTEAADADFKLVLDTNEIQGDFLGFFNPPGETYAGTGVFDGSSWDRQSGGDLRLGGFGFVTIMHELLHGMGLAHPHDLGGTSTRMQGVFSDFDDYGRENLNQGVFTTMTYNSGYWTGTRGSQPPFTGQYGYEAGPMALDIALLQALYGAAENNTGNTTYTLPGANKSGTSWRSIWDTGGTDTLRFEGTRDATLDLRAATLEYGTGGAGGFVSAAQGVAGGFTIAHGARIENATGGSGDDDITGNVFANVLVGRGGDDVIFGGAGADTIRGGAGDDRLRGSTGKDRLEGGTGTDRLWGGEGGDRLFGGDGGDTIEGRQGGDRLFGERGADRLEGGAGADVLSGGLGADLLRGGSNNDRLVGGVGRDVQNGGGGADTFVYTAVRDSKPGQNRDVIRDFNRGEDLIDLSGIDANWTSEGNQSFTFRGTNGFADAGDLRVQQTNGDTFVRVDTNGNGSANLVIELRGVTGLTADDFLL